MGKPPRNSLLNLRTTLFIIALLIILPLFVLVLYTSVQDRAAAAQRAKQDALQVTRGAASQQQQLIDQGRLFMKNLAANPDMQSLASGQCNTAATSILKDAPQYSNLSAALANGDLYCSALPVTGKINLQQRAYFQEVLKTHDFAVSDYLISLVNNKPEIIFAYPILDKSGAIQTVLVSQVDLEWINQLAASASLPAGSTMNVIDKSGTILAQYPNPDPWVGKSTKGNVVFDTILARQAQGDIEAAGPDGVTRLYAYVPLSQVQGAPTSYVAVGIPTTVAYADANNTLVRNLVGFGLVSVFAIALMAFVSDALIVRRTQILVSAAQRLSSGDLSARTGMDQIGGEFGDLARNFDQMAATLEQNAKALVQARDELEVRVQERTHELETVSQVSASTSTILDRDQLLVRVSDLTKASFNLYHAHVYLLDDAGANLTLAAGAGEAGRAMKAKGHQIALSNERSLVARAARAREGVIVNNVTTAPDFMRNPLLPNTNSEMALPMIVADRLVGVLDVQSDVVNRFADTDVRVMTTLASQIAVAVKNAGAFADVENARQLLSTIMNSTPDWIFVKDRNFRYLTVNEAFATWYGNRKPADMIGKDDYDLGTPTYLIEGDPAQGIRGFRADDQAVFDTGALVANPYDVVNYADGTIHVFDTRKLPLRDTAGNVIGMLGVSHDITDLQRAQDEIRKRAGELQTVAEVSLASGAILDINELLQTVVDLTKEQFNLYHAHVYLLDTASKQLVLAAGAGQAGRVMKQTGHSIPLNHERSLVARAARTHEGVVVNDVTQVVDFLPNPLLFETHSEMAVPMVVGGQVVGVLDVQSETLDRFMDTDVRVMTTLAGQVAIAVQNARTFAQAEAARLESEERAAALETVATVSAAATTVLDTDELLESVAELTKASFNLYHAHIYLLDDAGENLALAAGAGEAGRVMKARGHQIALNNERSLVARAARSREGVIVNDVTAVPDFMPNSLLPDTNSEMAVPMVVGDTLVGVLDVQSEKLDRFTETDVRVMTTLTAQVAVAVQNANTFGQIEESRRLLDTIINASPDWIFVKDRNFRYVTVNEAFATWYGNRTPADMVGRDDYDLGTPAYLIQGDPAQGIRGFRADDQAVFDTGAMITNPNDVVNYADGTIHIFDTRKLPLRDAAGTVIGSLGVSHDITDLQRAQEEVRRRAAELETVASVSAAATTVLNTDELLQTVADLTKASFNLYHAHVYLLNEATGILELAAGAGEAGRKMVQGKHRIRLTNERSVVARAARSREGVIVNDVTAVANFMPNPLLFETRAEMAVPMIVGDLVIGVLDVQSEKLDRFTETDMLIMTTLAAQVAVAVQNARTFTEVESGRQLLDTIINASPDWIFVKDRNFRYVTVNEAFATWYGNRKPADMIGKDDYDLGTPAYLIEGDPAQGIRGFRADDQDVFNTGTMITNPHDVVNYADGTIHIFDTRKLPLRDAAGNVIGMLGVSHDISDLQKAQEEVRKRARELQTVAEVSLATGTILDVNELLQTVVDLTKERFDLYHAHVYLLDAAGERLMLAAGAGQPGRVMKQAGHSIAVRNERSLVARAARTRGGVVVNDVSLVEDFLPNPLLVETRSEMAVPMLVGERLVGVLDVQSDKINRFGDMDVSVMTTLAEQTGVATENARLYQQELQTVQQLHEVDRLKSEFLANMSHELRTPLNSIIGYSQVILDGIDGDLPGEAVEDVEAIHGSGQHLLSMINDVLDLAKIEAGRMELDLEAVKFESVAEEVYQITSILLKDKQVELVLDVDPQLPDIWGDHVRLRQILNNLVSNASKFTEEGQITVQAAYTDAYENVVTHEPGMILVKVKDTGEGIAPEHLDLVFQQFRQVDASSTRRAGGTGMGLTITRHLVEMHGGQIWVESTVGEGSSFCFTVPAAQVSVAGD